jgi:hypothetical protein
MELDWNRIRAKLGILPKWEPPVVPKVQKLPEPDLPLASSSTGTIAGSWERIEVYRQRAANGESIFHPLDCKLIQDENPRCNAG